jgi:hypothetical protein
MSPEPQLGDFLARDDRACEVDRTERSEAGRKRPRGPLQHPSIDGQQLEGTQRLDDLGATLGDGLVHESVPSPRSLDRSQAFQADPFAGDQAIAPAPLSQRAGRQRFF